LAGRLLARDDQQELAVLRHRVFVFLPEIPPLDEHVDARRQRQATAPAQLTHLEVVEGNRAGVLFASEYEFSFLLSTGLLAPHGHRDRHQDRHDRERDEQSRHGVTPRVAYRLPAAARARALTT
jgi:hypothetical protein